MLDCFLLGTINRPSLHPKSRVNLKYFWNTWILFFRWIFGNLGLLDYYKWMPWYVHSNRIIEFKRKHYTLELIFSSFSENLSTFHTWSECGVKPWTWKITISFNFLNLHWFAVVIKFDFSDSCQYERPHTIFLDWAKYFLTHFIWKNYSK